MACFIQYVEPVGQMSLGLLVINCYVCKVCKNTVGRVIFCVQTSLLQSKHIG